MVLKHITDKIYKTSGHDEVANEVNKARHNKAANTHEIANKMVAGQKGLAETKVKKMI